MEHGREQRLNLYFAADAASWWIDGIQVYDGNSAGLGKETWVAFDGGPWAKTARGAAFEGDLDLEASGDAGPVTLHMADLSIARSGRRTP